MSIFKKDSTEDKTMETKDDKIDDKIKDKIYDSSEDSNGYEDKDELDDFFFDNGLDEELDGDHDPFDFDKLRDFDSPEDLMKKLQKIPKNKPRQNIRVINFPQRLSNNIFLNIIYILLINAMLIFSILGYSSFVFYQSFLDIIYYTLIFSAVEMVIKEIVYRYYLLLVFKSLGSILLAITVLAFLLADLSVVNIGFTSTSSLVFFILTFLIIRSLITNTIINMKFEKYFSGRKR